LFVLSHPSPPPSTTQRLYGNLWRLGRLSFEVLELHNRRKNNDRLAKDVWQLSEEFHLQVFYDTIARQFDPAVDSKVKGKKTKQPTHKPSNPFT
jgi:hypothetical protein